jgi:hypothetical protein
LKLIFESNAEADNFAYNISYRYYNSIEAIYHEHYAHIFPQWADIVSSLMLKLKARPVRYGIPTYDAEYTNLTAIFNDNLKMIERYRAKVVEVIEVAELSDDYEVKIAMEDFLKSTVLTYVAQADEWASKVTQYSEIQFDTKFAQLTHFIPIDK